MKNYIKIIISLSLISVMLFSAFSIGVSAANSVISFGKGSVTVGDTVNVTVTLNAGEPMYGVQCVVNYDSSILDYKSGASSGGAGVLRIVESPSGEKKVSYTLSFKAIKSGSCRISVSDGQYSGETVDAPIPGSSATLTVKDPSQSSNANLKSLHLSNGTLSPAFSASITSYNVTVKNSVTECLISAVAADSAAKVEVTGSSKLNIGKNTRSVIVTAPNGTSKTYTINIVRSETEEVTPTPEEPNPAEVTVGGVNYILAADISAVKLFSGFTAAKADFNGTEVAVAQDELKQYTIYYLKAPDNDELVPYTYDETNEIFEKLKYYTQGEKSYIFADIPNDKVIPEEYYNTNVNIAGMDVKCYASNESNMSDFYYLYCYYDGKYGFYRYDSRDEVLQRYPELELTSVENVGEERPAAFTARFKQLDSNGRIVIATLLFIVLAAIALVVLIIIRLVRSRKVTEIENGMMFDEDFDSVNISDTASEEADLYNDEKEE